MFFWYALPAFGSNSCYLRLHGPNNATWWEGKDAAERHDHRYTPPELEGIGAEISELQGVDTLWVIFNNTTKGHALYNIQMLKVLLEGRGLSVGGRDWQETAPEKGLFGG